MRTALRPVCILPLEEEIVMSIIPQGEDIRRAVKWISEMREDEPETTPQKLVEQACLKFNLSPMDAEYLGRWIKGAEEGD